MPALRDLPFFSNLDEAAAAELESHCTWRILQPGTLIIDYEDNSTDVLFIHTGQVRVQIRTAGGKEVILGDLGPGQYFGEMAAIDGGARSANVAAIERSQLCDVPAGIFMKVATGEPALAASVMQSLVARVRLLNTQLIERHFLTAGQRLCAELLRLSHPRASNHDERIVSPPPVQQDIANRIGASREAVSRELAAMEREGLLEKTRGGLILKDVPAITARIPISSG